MLFAACGSSSSGGSGNNNASGSTGAAAGSGFDGIGGNGAIPGLYTETTRATPGGSMTFAAGREQAWSCLPGEAQPRSGIQVAARSRLPDRAQREGRVCAFLADKVTPASNFTKWMIHLRSHQVPGRHQARRDVVKNNPTPTAASTRNRQPLLFVFVFDDITDVKVVDNMTVEVDMKTPWAAFPASLYSYGRLGIMAQKQLDDGKNCFSDMIGTGPFQLLDGGSWQINDHLTVVKNPNYWRKDSFGQKLPYLNSITFKPIPDTTQQLNGYKSKALDLGTDDTTTLIPGLLPIVKNGSFHLAVAKQNPRGGLHDLQHAEGPFNNINARSLGVRASTTGRITRPATTT
jgi:hypothetical protein